MGERGLQIIKLVGLLVVLVLVIVAVWGVFAVKSEVAEVENKLEPQPGTIIQFEAAMERMLHDEEGNRTVGTGHCGTKPAPVFPWSPFDTAEMFTTTKFFMNNPNPVGNITLDKWCIYLEDETEMVNKTGAEIVTPGGDNILTPNEIYEVDLMVYLDPTAHYEMYTLEVWYTPDEGADLPLTGFGLNCFIFIVAPAFG